MAKMAVSIIAAVGNQGQIGINNKLPWTLKDDLKNFKNLTSGNVIIMGRKTFESIGKILPNRINVIISRNDGYGVDGAYVFKSLDLALEKFKDKNIFICGGEEMYREALGGGYVIDKLYITNVDYNGAADTFFPRIDYSNWKVVEEKKYPLDVDNQYGFSFKIFERK